MEYAKSKQTVTGQHVEDEDVRQRDDYNDNCDIHALHIIKMPRVAQQPRAANGRNVSGSMAASPFKSPMKYEEVVTVFRSMTLI